MYNKNLIGPLQDLILENQTDIVALAEAKKIDITSLINSLKTNGKEWNDIRISTQNDIRVLARNGIDIIPFKEENHYSIYKIKKNSRVDCLLVVVHLLSKKSKSNEAQYNRANHIARELNKYEQEIFKSMEKRTIIVGDFNMQPYEAGICSGYGFNATMSANHAAKITREVDGEIVYFYYNPMWSLMGANKLVQGTYYNSSDKDDHAIYWYSFDSVLLRPCYIEKFSWNYFEIVEKTKKYNFVPNTTIDKERLYGKYYKHKQSIIDFFTGAGTGLVISCCISPDSIRRTVILCIGIAMFFIGGVKKLRWDKDVVKYLEKQEKEQ